MKIKVNYELMQKIDMANKGFSLNWSLINNSKCFGEGLLLLCLIDGIFSSEHKLDVLNNLPIAIIGSSIVGLIEVIFIKFFRKNGMKIAENDLKMLASQLSNLNVKTNVPMLKESIVQDTNYKFVLNKHNFPVLKQDKYILVPTYDRYGNDGVESLHQEHILGTKDYDISVGSPNKRLKLSLSSSPSM